MAIVSDVEIRLRADIARLQQDMNRVRGSVDATMNQVTRAANAARSALAGITAGLGFGELIRMTDNYTKYVAQLKLATDSTRAFATANADVKRIAASSQQDLQGVGVLYARIANATAELGVTQRQVAQVTEAVSASLVVSGATASEAASATLQLSQAFGSGVLRGEEFNAVNEAAPRLMKALADGIGVPVGALRKMAEEGLITSDVMARVLPKSLEKLRQEASQISTISGGFTVLKNAVTEFVGVNATASGSVAAVAGLLTALANNLHLVAGALLTVVAVKFANFLDAAIARTAASVTANNALIASNLAAAKSELDAALAADVLAASRLNEVRAATLASAGNVQLALTTNGLIPAQANAARTSAALSAAFFGYGAAASAAALGTRALNAALAFTGGPIGLIVTVLGAAATAWGIYEYAQQKANDKAAADTEASANEITANLEKQNNKLRERIKLQQQAGASEALTMNSAGADKLAETLKDINELKAKGATLDAADQIRLISLQGIYNGLNRELEANLALKKQEETNGQAAKALTDVRERLNGVNGQYLKDLGLLQTALAKGAIDQAEYTELVSKLAKETYAASEAGRAGAAAAKEAATAARQQADAYRDLLRSLGDRVDSTAREVAGLAPLSAAEQAHLDLTRQIADGKIRLTKTQEARARSLIDEARANEVLAKSNKEFDDLQKQLIDNAADLAKGRQQVIDSARNEAEQNEFLVETLGMTEDAIIRLTASRLLDQEAQRLGRDLTAEEIEDLQRVIELKERSAKAVADRRQLEETKQYWTDIEKTARDTFVSIADGGKNAFQRLKDTAKNVFFDWLYQQTLKKWIINIQANGSNIASSVGSLFGGSGSSGGAGSLLSSIGSIFGSSGGGSTAASGASSFMGGAAGYAGWIAAGMAVANKLFESGYQNTNTINKKDYFLPLVAESLLYNKVFKTIGLNDKMANLFSGASIATALFGRKNPEIERQGIQGTFDATGFTGKAFADILEKGGLFRSDKSYTKLIDLAQEQQDSFDSTITSMIASVRGFGQVVGAETSSLDSYSKQIKLTFGKDEAENEKMIADLFATIGDELATTLLPNVAKFQQAGETAAATLQRVAVNFAAVDQVLQAMGTDSQTAFRAVGVASIEARERLIALSGGIESLAAQTDYFVSNFLSEAEQIAIIQGPLNKALADLGYAGITTAEQFKDAVQGLVQSGALATEEGAKTYAGLLALGPQFKTVADYLKELSDAAAETAQNAKDAADALAAQALADNEALLRAAVDSAFDAVGRAVDAQREKVTAAYEADAERIASAMDRVSGRISDLTRLSEALQGAMGTVQSDAQLVASRGAARAQVQAAIAIAKSSGVLPSADDLAGALSTLRIDASDQFSTLADYQREVARTNNELATLGGMTEKQLTDAQRQLAVLESQKELLERNYQAEMERLDGILEWAQAEVDAINGVDRSVQSVVAAIAGLKVAGAALGQGATPSNPTGSNLTVEQLYRTVLGREGEAAGIAYWKNVFGAVVDADEYREFIKGAQPELDMQDRQRREASAVPTMSGTMSSSSASGSPEEMKQMKTDMARTAAAVEQLASQFNQVSGGGNSLLTEPA